MLIRRVVGNSMHPSLKQGQLVVAVRKKISTGKVVVAYLEGREVIKRVTSLKPTIVLKGDNNNSAEYDDVRESDILGVVIWPKI